jgi:mono/diheme cytochrome c family protein
MKGSFPIGAFAAVLLLALTSGASADPVEEALSRGEFLYRMHCAACHGSEGRGDGPVARELRTSPSDLTVLRDEAGTFPAERARRFIDGREFLGGHGSREMPIWGLTFQQRSRPGEQEGEVAGRIDDLVQYLRSIQRAREN